MRAFTIKYMDGRNAVETVISAKDALSARKEAERRGQVLSVTQSGGAAGWQKMSLDDRQVFFARLATMLQSKVGTSTALDVIYQSFNGTVREAARQIRDYIAAGATLDEAMEMCGTRYFPETVVAIIRTGSRGGDLAYALREAARFEKEMSEVKRESGKGIFSALSGFVAAVITILASTMYVAPQIMNSSLVTASGDGVDIGWVMTMANVISVIAVVVTIIIGGVLFLGKVMRPFAPAAIDRLILKIPFYRDMALAKSNYMVFFGLAVLLKAGLRVEEALTLTITGAPKGELRNDLERARNAIVNGSSQPWPYVMTMLHATDKAALATAQDKTQTASTIEDLAKQYQALYRSRLEMFVPAMQGFSAVFLSLAGFVLFGVSVMPLMQSTSSILKML